MRRVLIATTLLAGVGAQQPSPDNHLGKARQLQAEGRPEAALSAVRRALWRNHRSLPALRLKAELARALGDLDLAVHALHSWTDIVAAARKAPVPRDLQRDTAATLLELDPEAKSWSRLQKSYVAQLMALGRDYKRKKDLLGALEVYAQVLELDPHHHGARAAVVEIRRSGGREVAIEDVYAGGDPTFGKTVEQIEAEDKEHSAWEDAWTKQTDNYRYRTNAGFLVLETSAIAMEQMNRFYRRFFRYKEDGGKTPKIEIRIFKSRDEYLTLGRSPAPWSAGHFIGSAVETYTGGVTGKESIRSMYRTLFHEAAHQFVSLTGAFVPGWLNEAYASFFEGCVILSNGSVKWNQVPAGRLFPLAQRMDGGWMSGPDDGVRTPAGEWGTPERAPTFRIVVSGGYQWGPPWYAPTWGVVYFLYNYRNEDGIAVYRDALHEYYKSFKRGRPKDPVAHFEEIVLAGSRLSPARQIDDLDSIWRRWILELRDRHTGRSEGGGELLRFGDKAWERNETRLALQFYQEALDDQPLDPDVLEKVGRALEKLGEKAQAAATYRRLVRALEIAEKTEDERYATAGKKIVRLDPLRTKYRRMQVELATKGLALARSYEERKLPTMALEIARRMSASFSVPAAIDYYKALARRTGKSLAQWHLAYDERSLHGWSSGEGSYQAYGSQIRAGVAKSTEATEPGGLVTRQLVCDVTFDADYSLEARMRIESDGAAGSKGSLMGLCFGHKSASNFHAVMLHAKGFLDIATNRGGVWEIHDHRSTPLGSDWHTLRIDVVGRKLDVYLDGFYLRSLDFPSRDTMRGSFGLITGVGQASYSDIRLLARDAHDPAAAIERALAMERIAADSSLRAAGTFAGVAPPALAGMSWVQGHPVGWPQLAGRPVMLALWSTSQEKVIPTLAFYRHLLARGADRGLALVLVCEVGTPEKKLRGLLATHPLPGAHVGIDSSGETFGAFFVKRGHHGLPRVLLIDRAGVVQFEGDPGFTAGARWQPDDETYLDGPLQKLLREAPRR